MSRPGFRPRIETLEDRLTPTTLTVTNTNNGGSGSLRAAIVAANSLAGADTITFSITASGVQKINLLSALPAISEELTLDGTTQSGFTTTPVIVLNGSSAGAGVNGLTIVGDDCVIKGLVIQRFSGNGILILGDGNAVNTCFIGTNSLGTRVAGNGGNGVAILGGATDNIVGSATFASRNLISGSGQHGVLLQGMGVTGNSVTQNYIGCNLAGTFALPNRFDGVALSQGAHDNFVGSLYPNGNFIAGNNRFGINISGAGTSGNNITGNSIGSNRSSGVQIAAGAADNTIGGATPSFRNVIVANGANGIILTGAGVTGNTIQSNFIGTNFSGSGALPNQLDGILVTAGASGNTIGGTIPGVGNLISGNRRNGVNISGSGTSGNTMVGNFIGLSFSGTSSIPNGASGVQITAGGRNNTIGGTTAESRNIISGNTAHGVILTGAGVTGNVLLGNYIGTNVNGVVSLANRLDGVTITAGAASNTVGGTAAGAGNTISGNTRFGVSITGNGTVGNTLLGNIIGLKQDGSAALANGSGGVQVASGANGTTIGGIATGAGNTISGNSRFGILVNGVNQTTIQGNKIGTKPDGTGSFGNTAHGVFLTGGAANNTIGGTATGAGNTISNNGGVGVLIGSDPATAFKTAAGTGNAVLGNSIFNNVLLGIDLGPKNGRTANDAGDVDNGPNHFQNFPVVNSATIINAGADVQIAVTLNSVPNTTFRVECFVSTASDPSGFGEGRKFLGFITVTTNSAGVATGTGTFAYAAADGTKITTTATNLTTNDTSEFSFAGNAV